MIVILKSDINESRPEFRQLMDYLGGRSNITTRVHKEVGALQTLIEIYLIGNTAALDKAEIESLPGVERVVRVTDAFRIIGRHRDDSRPTGFEYNGVRFNQDNLNIFAGLCAVDTREHTETMMRALKDNGQVCTRMGAYKPRTNPYAFQGHGGRCLPWVFELAGKYGIKVIAMEITHDSHLDEIRHTLDETGHPTGVMLQIGTRNTQNFELLKNVGRQQEFPVLLKRGFGITLEESLNAAEYLASEGNRKIVFALRGMKTNLADPHRNFVDFAHVPVVKRLTRMPVCVDPSHSVGSREQDPHGILDVMHVTAQGIIAGANMVLVDFHPAPKEALVDGPQALVLEELPYFLEDVAIAREAYEKRAALIRDFRTQQARQQRTSVGV
ncbi:MAG: 3-deoxy-7-phosphoheptulonate synthase [Acidiferrobacterales bacterium]